ncbi:MAG: DUF4364 family protein [Christensenellaceae bacterium]|jgi:hypothetical protein|nr:DUF4364 family protein [Christensenellaceae bacterium]
MQERRKPPGEQKLLILYAVREMGALELPELERFILGVELLTYMEFRLSLYELVDTGHLRLIPGRLDEACLLTEEGRQALDHFEKRIPQSLRETVRSSTAAWRQKLIRERQVFAEYSKNPQGFGVQLYLLEQSNEMINIKLELPDEAMARKVCQRWQAEPSRLYKAVLSALLGEEL